MHVQDLRLKGEHARFAGWSRTLNARDCAVDRCSARSKNGIARHQILVEKEKNVSSDTRRLRGYF